MRTALALAPPSLPRILSALAALVLVGAGAGFAWFAEEARRAAPDAPPDTDAIAVLTGGPDRVEAGLRLAAARPGVPLMISGVGRDADLASLARQGGVEPWPFLGRITLGRQARSTRGNAAEIGGWARARGLGSLTVVTAGFHMPRALLELRRELPGVALVAVPVPPRAPRPSLMLREYGKLVGAWAGLSGTDPLADGSARRGAAAAGETP